jgi:hypothetical protein
MISEALTLLGVKQKRPLPYVNKTRERKNDFLSYYTPDIIEQAKRVFGTFMKQWKYNFPPRWGDITMPWLSQIEFHFFNIIRNFYWKYLRSHIP